MSLPGEITPLFLSSSAAAGDGDAAYQIDRSLRFNSADSSYFSFQPSSAGNRKTWTWSGWVKRSAVSTSAFQNLFSANNSFPGIRFNNVDQLELFEYSGSYVWRALTNAVFRDPSAWYHICFLYDTTQATAADRIKLYVNNQIQTYSSVSYPSQNRDGGINSNVEHTIGCSFNNATANEFFNGYLADVYFIDGQALEPTDFGEYDDNNVWQPKEFSGTYSSGVNYLADFTTNGTLYSGTSLSNAFDGNISTPAQLNNNTSNQTLTFTPSGGIPYTSSVEVYIFPSGNVAITRYSVNGGSDQSLSGTNYWQTILSGSGTFNSFVMKQGAQSNSAGFSAIRVDGTILVQGTGFNSFYLPFSDNSSNVALGYDQKETVTLNPDGGMDVVTYTGNGSTQTISGLGFQPDFVWIKNRDATYGHIITDSVRGNTKLLFSYAANAESTVTNAITGFTSDGFTLGAYAPVNNSGNSHVAWCWKAGGAASLNENGSINSQVSVSTDYGFSIVSYTGNGNNGATIGHSLGATPAFVIVKNRDAAKSWNIYHQSYNASTDIALVLDGTDVTAGTKWRGDLFSSTVFGVRNVAQLNDNNNKYIAYCWSEVSGFSKFGSYTGTGLSSGNVITVGFKPRYVLIKNTSRASAWRIYDTARGNDKVVNPNTAGAEFTTGDPLNFTNTSFEPTGTTNEDTNKSGDTYIYAAFADRPGNNFDVNNLVATAGNTVSASSVSLTAPSSGFLSGRDSKTYVIDGDTSSYLLANNSGDNYSVNFSPGISVSSSVEIYGLTSGQSASTNLSSATSYTSGQYSTIYSGSGTLTQITMIASGNRPGLAAIKVDGVLLIGTNDESGIDSLVDSPTNGTQTDTGVGGEVVGNYATLNPADYTVGTKTFSNGNLDISSSSTQVRGTMGLASGKWYWEITVNSTGAGAGIGICDKDNSLAAFATATNYCWGADNNKYINGSSQGGSGTTVYGAGDIVGLALDVDASTLQFYRNGSAAFSFSSLPSEVWFPWLHINGFNFTCNFGQRAFAYTAPSGFKALCTANLTDPTIADGSTAMDVVTYTGNNSAQTISGLGFSPDLAWIKNRSGTQSHVLVDTVRGRAKSSYSNLTVAENTSGSTNDLVSFDATGFTLGPNSQSGVNTLNAAMVAWTWDGGTSTVSNTDGSITSSVRANASAGFSIVTYTGNGSSGATVGHGLNAAPGWFTIACRNTTNYWDTWHSGYYVAGSKNYMRMNSTGAAGYAADMFQTPTSSVVTLGTSTSMNGSNNTYVMYCWTPVEGYSAFGSYTGNGASGYPNADGPFIFTGMRPRFVLIKASSQSENWVIYDTARSTFNVLDDQLYPNATTAETSGANREIDVYSNGFKIRSNGGFVNASGATYVYAAFAEHPLKTARAR